MNLNDIKVIAFDADDTLWDNQTFFDDAEENFLEVMKEYGSREFLEERLFETEMGNMKLLGFGGKPVCISMMEAALKIAGDRLKPFQMEAILAKAKSLMEVPATPLEGVEDALLHIASLQRYRMIVLTKGDILDQNAKVDRSGLRRFFERVVVFTDKTPEAFEGLCRDEGISPDQLLMVGNSFKSDIKPVIAIGGYGVHIPFHTIWRHEKVEEFEHPNVVKLSSIAQMPDLFV